MSNVPESSPLDEFYQWLAELDQEYQPAELIENPEWLEAPLFEADELERLDLLAREYAQELDHNGLLPDVPALEIDEKLLEPEKMPDDDHEIGR